MRDGLFLREKNAHRSALGFFVSPKLNLVRLWPVVGFIRLDAMDFRLDVGQQFSSNHAKQKGAGLFWFFSHGSVDGSMNTRKVEIVIHAG